MQVKRASVIVWLVMHTVIVYALFLIGLLLSVLIELVVPGAGQTSSFLGRALETPFWLMEVGCGAIGGWLIGRRFPVKFPILGIVVPTLLLCLDILIEGREMRKYTSLMDVYFTANNGGTEGIYNIMLVAPLYTAIAYTLGDLASKLTKARAHKVKQRGGLTQE